ncbi:MAG: PHP domain-containing protein [Bacillota bacterium]|nr:PHP domain-containing protein [Bacillota bacterium]
MARQYLIRSEGNWYKSNLHCHTTCSDGKLTPEEVKELYKSHGYSIVAYTDHNKLINHKELNDDKFLALCGYEIDVIDHSKPYQRCCHLNAIAKNPETAEFQGSLEEYSADHINKMIEKLISSGFIVNYNHPSWSMVESEEISKLHGFTAIEVYNHSAQMHLNSGCSSTQYGLFIRNGGKAYSIAADDNHNFDKIRSTSSDSLGGFTVLKATDLSYKSIIDSFETGNFYCSSGPEIYDYYIEDGKLCLHCSPIASALHRNEKIIGGHISSSENDITYVEFPIREEQPFGYIEISDLNGKTAFTNPVYFK